MKKGFIFMLLMLSVFLQAQNKANIHHSCMDKVAPALYNWAVIETKFSKQLHITSAECKNFFRYAAKYDYLKMNDYRALEKEGVITKNNAQQYWQNKLPYFEDVYKFKYLPAVEAEKTADEKRQEAFRNGTIVNGTMSSSCNNLDFSAGTLANWVGQWNDQGTSGTIINGGTPQGYGNLTVNGFNSGGFNSMGYVHELCNGGTDPNVPISRVAPGHSYSLRLGNDSASRIIGQGSNNSLPFNHQTISNTFVVTQANQTITYWYAVVLCQYNPNNHGPSDQPYFRIRMYDGNGQVIQCASYDVNALTAPSIGGFNTVEVQVPSFNGGTSPYDFFYKNWSPVLIPLSQYIGQTVTLTFESSDCGGGGHPGYAYLAVDCAPQQLIVDLPQPCIGGNTTLTAPAGLASYSWTGPGIVGSNTGQVATVNAGGTYSVTMTTFANSGQTGCQLILSDTIQPSTVAPVASFSATTPCLHNNTQFTDGSTLLSNQGTINAWSWNFGDGGTSSSNNPTHLYTTAGTFPVSYSITSSVGCSATYSAMVTVNPLPTASFIADTVCKGLVTTFTNNSIGGTSYNWSFGIAGATSTAQNPTNTYVNSGIYAVTLTVTSGSGCKAVATNNVMVAANAVVAFTSPNICLGATSIFNNTSTPTTNVAYSWNFGDASNSADTSNLQSPTYFYPTAGTYSVTLTITSTSGCVSSKTHTISVKPIPQVAVTSPPPYCWNDVVLSPTYTSVPTTGVSFSWINNNTNIGLNQTNGTATPPPFIAGENNTGNDIVGVLTVTPSLNGCAGPSESYTITIKPTPTVAQNSLHYCPGDLVLATTLTASPVTSTITWSTTALPYIGLSTTSGSSVIPPFTAIGSGAILQSNAIVVNVSYNGCVGPVTIFSLTVDPYPVAKFTYSSACDGNNTQFINESTSGGSPITQWNWDFGNENTSALQNPSFLLTPANIYHSITLQVTTIAGCKDSITEQVYINPSAQVNFMADTISCTPLVTTFTNVVSMPVSTYIWNFGNTVTATYTTQTAAQQTYTNGSHTQNSYFTVSLTVVTDSNCVTTVTKPNYITVHPKPLAGFAWGPKDADIIDPTISFYDQSIGASGTNAYNWNFGDIYETVDSLNYSTISNPKHTYSDQAPGQYDVWQFIQNIYGCKDSIKEIIYIKDAVTFYIPNAFSPDNDGTNDGFKGMGIGIKSSTYNMWIFDRWGLMIFHSVGLDKSWDGRVNGKSVQQDVYVWKVSFDDDFNRSHDYHGTVTLLK